MKNFTLIKTLPIFALLAGGTALAQTGNFPEKDLVLTVNYGPASNTDIAARALAQGMEKVLGKNIVVENRSGALGTLGITYLARQNVDPHRLGIITYAPIAISPHLMDVSYTIDDFDFVCAFGRFRYGVSVRADSPYQTIEDLVTQAKSGAGVFFGASSPPNLLALLELGRVTGGKFDAINYRSSFEATTALLGDTQIEAVVHGPSDALVHIQSGRLRMLASASPVRWHELPDIPTLQEAGYPVSVDSWVGLGVKSGASPQAVKTLEQACLDAVSAPETSARIANSAGIDPVGLSGAQYRSSLAQGYTAMGAAIKAANIPRITN